MEKLWLGQNKKFWVSVGVIFLVVQLFFFLGDQRVPVFESLFSTYVQMVLQMVCVMIIISLGLNLIYGFNGQFSLGQWGFYAIGAYASADLTYRFADVISLPLDLGPLHFDLGHVVLFLGALLFGAVLAALVAYIFGLPVLKMGGDYFGIATLGFTMIIKVLADNSDKVFPEMKGARGMIGIPHLTTWFWAFLAVVLVLIVTRNLIYSTVGRAIISVREDEIAAKAMGIDVARYKTLSFVVGGFYAGLAGGLYAHLYAFLAPSTFHFVKSFDPWIIIVFGGVGSMTGTVVGTIFWAGTLEGLRILLPVGTESWRYVIYPLALLLIMLLRPEGVMGRREWGFLKPMPLSRLLGRPLPSGKERKQVQEVGS